MTIISPKSHYLLLDFNTNKKGKFSFLFKFIIKPLFIYFRIINTKTLFYCHLNISYIGNRHHYEVTLLAAPLYKLMEKKNTHEKPSTTFSQVFFLSFF